MLLSCGTNVISSNSTSLARVELPMVKENIKQIECGIDTSFVLTDQGDLYFWGSLSNLISFNHPVKLNNGYKIKTMSTKNKHIAAVDDSGNVIIWGSNQHCHFSNRKEISIETPQILRLNPEKAISVSCGGYFTLILLENGEVMSLGINHDNILGLERAIDVMNIPTKIDSRLFGNEKVSQISAGWSHSCILTESGKVYSWGRQSEGRLGHDNGDSITQITMNIDDAVDSVCCGDTNTFCIKNGIAKATGMNNYGENGVGDTKPRKHLRSIKGIDKKIKKIASCADHTITLTEDGSVYGIGFNENNKMGLITETIFLKPEKIITGHKVENISSSNSHTLFLVE